MNITVYGCDEDAKKLFVQSKIDMRITDKELTAENALLALGCECISISHKAKIDIKIISLLNKAGVKFISTRSIGVNHIDVEAAARYGITVENTGYSPDSVAEHTIMLMLMSLRHMKAYFTKMEQNDYTLYGKRSRELRDMTVGVVGTGAIGRCLIEKLKAFGCKILAFDNYHNADVNYVSYDKLLAESDIISFHLPLKEETHHMLNMGNITKLKNGCCIINTARGGLIENEALRAGLESEIISAAALDVIEGEECVFYKNG